MNCEITLECSQDGKCDVKSQSVEFKSTPKDVEHHGEGTYEISYLGNTTVARMLTQYGPMIWAVEGEAKTETLQTLTSIGMQTEMEGSNDLSFVTWSSVELGERPSGKVRFMQCEAK